LLLAHKLLEPKRHLTLATNSDVPHSFIGTHSSTNIKTWLRIKKLFQLLFIMFLTRMNAIN